MITETAKRKIALFLKEFYNTANVGVGGNASNPNSDTLDVPESPVIQLAVALATRERGETGGTSTAEYFQIANRYLGDAIAHDAGRHPEELIFYTP